jgi:hypothetical protein
MGLTNPLYFFDKWDPNFRSQTTIQRCGASAMHLPTATGKLGVCVAHPTAAAVGGPKSPSRLRCLSQWRSMVMRPYSPVPRRSSSALRSAMARLAAGPRSALSIRAMATKGVHDCACDGAGAPPEW